VAHTYEVIAGAWRLNKLLIDHESGLRAYILTRDEAFLEPYRAARAEIPQAFDQVEAMVRDNPAEQLRIDHLRSRYVQWLRSAEEAINGAGQRDIRALPDFLETMRARKAQMDGMREATQQILSEEGRLLHERQGRSEATEARLFWGGGFIALALAVVATFLLRRVIGILEASYLQAYRAQAESARKADEANRAKDDFLAILSHELRTPLNAIAGWSHILIGEGVDRTTVRKGAEIINRNAMAQTQLISDILDVSRIITGKLRLNVGAADLATVVERALEAVTVAAAAKDIRIETVLDPMSPVSCDADRLQQVVWNLLANAIKFTPKAGVFRCASSGSALRSRSRSETTVRGCRPTCCPTSSNVFGRETRPPLAPTAAWAWVSPSCGTSPNFTEGRSRPRTALEDRERCSPCACRCGS
jgi:signal transduction histidine kinase